MPEAKVDTAASGDTTLVAAVAGIRLDITKLVLVAAAAVNVKFKSGVTDLTGAMPLAADGQLILNKDTVPWLTITTGDAMIINLSGAVQVSGVVVYELVRP